MHLEPVANPASLATQYALVFQPGGVAAGNVYTDWASLYAALNLAAPASANGTRPTSEILVDDSFAAAIIPAGAYNLDGVTFKAVRNSATATEGAALSFAVGATISPAAVGSVIVLTTGSLSRAPMS